MARRSCTCHWEKLSEVTSAFTLYVHSTSLPDVDGQLPTVPMYFALSMEAIARNTQKLVFLVQEGV